MDEQDARDLIVRVIAGLYLNAQSAQARVDAAQSRVTDSATLLKLAQDKHDRGNGDGRGRAARAGAACQRPAGFAGGAEPARDNRCSCWRETSA
jgi:hypothetical protein